MRLISAFDGTWSLSVSGRGTWRRWSASMLPRYTRPLKRCRSRWMRTCCQHCDCRKHPMCKQQAVKHCSEFAARASSDPRRDQCQTTCFCAEQGHIASWEARKRSWRFLAMLCRVMAVHWPPTWPRLQVSGTLVRRHRTICDEDCQPIPASSDGQTQCPPVDRAVPCAQSQTSSRPLLHTFCGPQRTLLI